MSVHHRIGVIDIGSNSVHLVIGVNNANHCFSIVNDAKVNVRLCEGFTETGKLRQDRMDLGIKTLAMFRRMCEAYQLDRIVTVATAAVRKAKNGLAFCKRAKEEAGIDIQIISGEEEATYDYLGVVNSLDVSDALMMDIGGGSAEFVLIKNREKVDAVSLPFGSIDLTERFDLSDKIKTKNLNALSNYLKGAYSLTPLLQKAEGLPLIGVGGTIRNIGRIHRRQTDYPLEIAHNYVMSRREVKTIANLAAGMDNEERRNLKGLAKGRTDIFVGASRAVYEAMKWIHSEKLIISEAGLRDGIIYETLGYGEGHLIPDVYEQSVSDAMANHDVNVPHARHMVTLCGRLYEELAPLCEDDDVRVDVHKILRTSALLHDCGIKIAYHNHHEHSFYLILNAGLHGLSQKEILMSALAAKYHRINRRVRVDPDYEAMLTPEDIRVIDEIGLMLSIGEQLDRSMDGAVKDVRCEIFKDRVLMHLDTVHDSVFAPMIVDECGKKFRRVFERDLQLSITRIS